MNIKYVYSNRDDSLSINFNDEDYTLHVSENGFYKFLDAVKSNIENNVLLIIDELKYIESLIKNRKLSNDLKIENGNLVYKGFTLSHFLYERTIKILEELQPDEYSSYIRFLEKLSENGSKKVIDNLLQFIEKGALSITQDGDFYSFKAVRPDYYDKHSGKILNRIGEPVSVPRWTVDSNVEQDCSQGLHTGIASYVANFGSKNDRYLITTVNPYDVVCVPTHGAWEKLRCCQYYVLCEITKDELFMFQNSERNNFIINTNVIKSKYAK